MNQIICGDQVIDFGSEARITIFVNGIGTICVGGNDLYDLGLRHSEIVKANGIATLKIGGVKIELEAKL
jgi:hypothetical protein